MPWITINMVSGHSAEKKKRLHKDVAAAVQNVLDIPADWVKVQIIEMKDENHSIGGVPINELQNSNVIM